MYGDLWPYVGTMTFGFKNLKKNTITATVWGRLSNASCCHCKDLIVSNPLAKRKIYFHILFEKFNMKIIFFLQNYFSQFEKQNVEQV